MLCIRGYVHEGYGHTCSRSKTLERGRLSRGNAHGKQKKNNKKERNADGQSILLARHTAFTTVATMAWGRASALPRKRKLNFLLGGKQKMKNTTDRGIDTPRKLSLNRKNQEKKKSRPGTSRRRALVSSCKEMLVDFEEREREKKTQQKDRQTKKIPL